MIANRKVSNIWLKTMNILKLWLETGWEKTYKVGGIDTFYTQTILSRWYPITYYNVSLQQNRLSEISPAANVPLPPILSSSTQLLWFIIVAVINERRQPYRAHHAFIELLIAPRGRTRQVIHARHARSQRFVQGVSGVTRALPPDSSEYRRS